MPVPTVRNALQLAQTLAVTGATTLTGAATLQDDLTVAKVATLSSTLGVTGATTLSSTVEVTGAADLNSTLEVAKATTLESTLLVNNATTLVGAATLQDDLTVAKVATLSSTLNVTGATTLGAEVRIVTGAVPEAGWVLTASNANGDVEWGPSSGTSTTHTTSGVTKETIVTIDASADGVYIVKWSIIAVNTDGDSMGGTGTYVVKTISSTTTEITEPTIFISADSTDVFDAEVSTNDILLTATSSLTGCRIEVTYETIFHAETA